MFSSLIRVVAGVGISSFLKAESHPLRGATPSGLFDPRCPDSGGFHPGLRERRGCGQGVPTPRGGYGERARRVPRPSRVPSSGTAGLLPAVSVPWVPLGPRSPQPVCSMGSRPRGRVPVVSPAWRFCASSPVCPEAGGLAAEMERTWIQPLTLRLTSHGTLDSVGASEGWPCGGPSPVRT